ncbi:hypothetical protein ACFCW6_35625 [Streptomyces sp. NPDC056333]
MRRLSERPSAYSEGARFASKLLGYMRCENGWGDTARAVLT